MVVKTKFFRHLDLAKLEDQLNTYLSWTKIEKKQIVKIYYNAVVIPDAINGDKVLNTAILIWVMDDDDD